MATRAQKHEEMRRIMAGTGEPASLTEHSPETPMDEGMLRYLAHGTGNLVEDMFEKTFHTEKVYGEYGTSEENEVIALTVVDDETGERKTVDVPTEHDFN